MTVKLACSKRSDSGEGCEVKKAMKSRGGLEREVREPFLTSLNGTTPPPSLLFFALLFSSHRSPLSERLEQATVKSIGNARSMQIQSVRVSADFYGKY